MTSVQPSLWHRLRAPLIAILLGLLPFWLFVGMSQTTKINGEVVQDSSLNVLGIVLAVIGIVIAFKMLRDDGSFGQPPRWWARTVLAIVAILLGLFQGVYSLGLVRLSDIEVAIMGRPAPPPSTYAGLDPGLKASTVTRSAALDQGRLRDDIVTTLIRIGQARARHNAYAESCHRGKWQIEAADLPAVLDDADRREIADKEAAAAVEPAPPCAHANARRFMTGLSDDVSQDRDILALQLAAYRDRFGSAAPAAAAPSGTGASIDGVPVAPGDSVAQAQQAFRTSELPRPYTSAGNQKRFALYPADGFSLFLTPAGEIDTIRLDKPFAGSIGGVRIGDSLRTLKRLMGETKTKPFSGNPQGSLAYLYTLPNGVTARFDATEERGVEVVFLFK
ncbi:hypothetical protein [Inquilinus sp.]|uniref:hypothetical protein n=1 Tax=Inquilinus sp. TaxID=1932117 RepID=UPI003784828E